MKLADVIKLKNLEAGGPGSGRKPGEHTMTPDDVRFKLTKTSPNGDKYYTHPAGHKLVVSPDGKWAVHHADGQTTTSETPTYGGALSSHLWDSEEFYHNRALDKAPSKTPPVVGRRT